MSKWHLSASEGEEKVNCCFCMTWEDLEYSELGIAFTEVGGCDVLFRLDNLWSQCMEEGQHDHLYNFFFVCVCSTHFFYMFLKEKS